MSIVGEHHFGMVMRTDFLMKFFFFHGGSLGKVTGSKIEVVVVETVVGVVERVVWANLQVLLEVVILL